MAAPEIVETAPYQDGFTIITRILPDRKAELIHLLGAINREVENSTLVPFTQLETIHFARWVVLEASEDAMGRETPTSLIFSTNFDEPAQKHLDELYDKAGAGLHRIYSHCEGYPPEGERTKERVLAYLRSHETGYNTLYVGTRGRTVGQIRKEARLRDAIQGFLDEATCRPAFMQKSASEIRADIQEFVRSRSDLAWATQAPPESRNRWPRSRDLLIVALVAALVLAPIITGLLTSPATGLLVFAGLATALVLALVVWFVMLRIRERKDVQYPATTNFVHVRSLAQNEDRIVQNQMSSVTNIKPGHFRLITLRMVLGVIELAGRYIYTKGRLGTIPSIHFARWVIIDGGRRLVFFSNFDGSWENYLGDFIDKAASGLTAVWSNTYGFPKTRRLILDGARDEQRFKAYARNSQMVTQVWYSAYKRLTVQNINNNSQIRAGLFGPQSTRETEAWLRRL